MKLKTNLPCICILFGIIHFVGCSPIYYIPKTQNVPLLSQQGNINLSLLYSDFNYEVQSSYALTNHIGLMANGSYSQDSYSGEERSRPSGEGKDLCGEAGIGYYDRIGEKLIFEIYGILALGKMENNFPGPRYKNTIGFIGADYEKYSLQPALGYVDENVEIALSSKLTHLNFSNIYGNLIFYGENQLQYLYNNRSNLIFEPALTLRIGWKNVKFQGQLSLSYNLSNRLFYQEEYLASFGMYISLLK